MLIRTRDFIRSKLEYFKRNKFILDEGRRAFSASDVLFLEAANVGTQEDWHSFVRFLIIGRVWDQRNILRKLIKHNLNSGSETYVTETIREELKKTIKYWRSQKDITSGIKSTIKISSNEDFAQFITGLRAKELPESIAHELDQSLCIQHRHRVLRGVNWKDNQPRNKVCHESSFFGLSISGGGIRSASFAMGVLQSLAEKNLLEVFQWISSVSGGGYTASWLMAWAYRHTDGIQGVSEELRTNSGHEIPPIKWVRKYSSYLAPRLNMSVTGDAAGLLIAYASNWVPVFLLFCSALIVLLSIPHGLLAIAQSLVKLQYNNNIILLAAIIIALFIALIRRLTMYYRSPGKGQRESVGLPAIVVASSILTTVALSTLGAVLLHWAKLRSGNDNQLLIFYKILVFWLLVYSISSILAKYLASQSAQRIIDSLLRVNKNNKDLRGNLAQLNAPFEKKVIATLASVLFSSAFTLLLVKIGRNNDSVVHISAFGPAVLTLFIASSELANGVILHRYMQDTEKAWLAKMGGWLFTGAVAWTAVSSIALTSNELLEQFTSMQILPMAEMAVVAGLLSALIYIYRIYSAAHFFLILIFLCTLSITVVSPIFSNINSPLEAWGIIAFMAIIASVWGYTINVNRFSLHSIYREGLVRTFLGASRRCSGNRNISAPPDAKESELPQFLERKSDPITNIDNDDNPELWRLQSRLARRLPMFLLNASVNGSGPGDVTGRVIRQWPYTFSPHYCGSPATGIGYSPAKHIFKSSDTAKALSLGTAMAASGAAISPTAGRTGHPLRAFLLGLLNARLGLWVGNPNDEKAVTQESPPSTGFSVLGELLGIHSKFMRWIHLSDGGHFENLGIYELLRRGCSRIVAIDGSCDPLDHQSDLANAIRRARIDLGIIIRNDDGTDFLFESGAVSASPTDIGRRHRSVAPQNRSMAAASQSWRWFTIDYGNGMPFGRILYIRPIVSNRGNIPIEVRQYWKASKSFPHETTADQFFTEAQMEAYRSLGQVCGTEALSAAVDINQAGHGNFDETFAVAMLRRSRALAKSKSGTLKTT